MAKMILRRYDNSIDRASVEEHAIPAFWIDMSLLYEHYVLGALRKAYGPKILYQANVTTGKPDFLYVDGERPLILDTKYKPRYGTGTFDKDDIRQLAGYARDRKALKKLGIQEAEEQSSAVVPCVIIYPEVRGGGVKFDGLRSPIDQVQLEVAPIGEFVGFYRMGFPLPVLSAGLAPCLPFQSAPGVNKKCKVRIAAHTAILKFDRRVALRSAMPAAFLCRQCIPASLHRAATSVLQADSIMPDPM